MESAFPSRSSYRRTSNRENTQLLFGGTAVDLGRDMGFLQIGNTSSYPPARQASTDTLPRYGEWTLDIYRKNSTIALSPDYRLLPESTGLDILQDASDFYTWLFHPGNLSAHLPTCITPNLDSILVTGESAGGWHALQAAFLRPDRIGAIIFHYPMIDIRSPHFSSPPPPDKKVFDPPRAQMDPEVLEEYVAKLEGGEVVPFRAPPEGELNVLIMTQQGLYGKYFGTDERLYPLEMLDRVEKFPPTWMLHGTKDSVVPVSGTRMFVEKMGRSFSMCRCM